MIIPFDKFKARLLADPEVRREYAALSLKLESPAATPQAARSFRNRGRSSSIR
jgi:hypothetical protein